MKHGPFIISFIIFELLLFHNAAFAQKRILNDNFSEKYLNGIVQWFGNTKDFKIVFPELKTGYCVWKHPGPEVPACRHNPSLHLAAGRFTYASISRLQAAIMLKYF